MPAAVCPSAAAWPCGASHEAGADAQRGAATILAVIFLVISVSLMVVAALNMAGSDITDTALNHDAIEALFIAESGVEHAAHAYANGTPCLGPGPRGADRLRRW
jgi:Tfp pilus assembly protein PilX